MIRKVTTVILYCLVFSFIFGNTQIYTDASQGIEIPMTVDIIPLWEGVHSKLLLPSPEPKSKSKVEEVEEVVVVEVEEVVVVEAAVVAQIKPIQNELKTKTNKSSEPIVCAMIDTLCEQMEFDNPALIKSMVFCESGFNTNSISKYNAQGLMQITPRWFGELMRQYGVEDLCADEEGNLQIGIHYMKTLIQKYDGDVHKALVAYNCGASKVDVKHIYITQYSTKVLKIAGDYK